MIVELGLAVGAVAALYAYRRRARLRAERIPARREPPPARAATAKDEVAAASKAARRPGLQREDVLLYADTELWLAGCLALDDGADVLSLFVAPGSRRASHVAQLDREGEDIALLSAYERVPAGRVPDELSVDGARLSLRRRGRASVSAEGESLPPHRPQADYVLLGAPSGRVLLVVDFVGGERIALLGERVPPGMLDVLPGGG